MSANWKAGDKAVCVDDTINPNVIGGDLTKAGTIYLVQGVVDWFDAIGLELTGMNPGECIFGQAVGYRASRFRKVVTATERAEQERSQLIPHEGFWQSREAQP